jgi:hypothetical protein
MLGLESSSGEFESSQDEAADPSLETKSDHSLPTCFLSTDIIEALKRFDTEITAFNYQTLATSIYDGEYGISSPDPIWNNKDRADKVKKSDKLENDEKSILVFTMAGPCSIILTFDANGNAKGIHESMQYVGGAGGDNMLNDVLSKYFKDTDHVSQDSIVFSTATNVIRPGSEAVQSRILSMIKNHPQRKTLFPNQAVESLMVRPESSAYLQKQNLYPEVEDSVPLDSELPVMGKITGLIFVPKTVDSQKKNRLFIVEDSKELNEESVQQLLFNEQGGLT